ncbi:MAG: hypothetical protein AB8D52_07640, partial [Gammaproteobacteria bacterium]
MWINAKRRCAVAVVGEVGVAGQAGCTKGTTVVLCVAAADVDACAAASLHTLIADGIQNGRGVDR